MKNPDEKNIEIAMLLKETGVFAEVDLKSGPAFNFEAKEHRRIDGFPGDIFLEMYLPGDTPEKGDFYRADISVFVRPDQGISMIGKPELYLLEEFLGPVHGMLGQHSTDRWLNGLHFSKSFDIDTPGLIELLADLCKRFIPSGQRN